MSPNDLGARIREQREKLGLKQLDLANALRVSPQAVSKWERGENAPDITTLAPLAAVLGVSTDWLLGSRPAGPSVFEATVCFFDIAGFAAGAKSMQPVEIADWLNAHFFQLTEVVLRFDGVPVKCIGDAFLCFFSGPDHRARAVHAARHAMKVAPKDPRFGLHSGLNAGDVYLGAIGHPEYARPDILGDAVNLAAQTQWWSGQTESGLAATGSVVQGLDPSIPVRGPHAVDMKGRTDPVEVWEIVVE